MRQAINPQPELGAIRIGDIELDMKLRGIPALPVGLQHLYADGDFRRSLLVLLKERMIPGVDGTSVVRGMEM